LGERIVNGRRSGFYAVRAPIIIEVLNRMRTYFRAYLEEALGMLDEMEKPLETVR
jgi:hypothetical protein